MTSKYYTFRRAYVYFSGVASIYPHRGQSVPLRSCGCSVYQVSYQAAEVHTAGITECSKSQRFTCAKEARLFPSRLFRVDSLFKDFPCVTVGRKYFSTSMICRVMEAHRQRAAGAPASIQDDTLLSTPTDDLVHGFQSSHLNQATVALPNLPCLIILHRKSIEDELPFRTGTATPALVQRSGQRTDSLSEKSHAYVTTHFL
jgi:hypothetical protein